MHKHGHFKSTTSILDLFMLLTVGFVILFVLAFLLIKPPQPGKEDIPLEEQLLIKMEWDDHTNIDLDMWLMDPEGNVVAFKNRTQAGITLERDDLGYNNDFVFVDGELKPIKDNTEVIRIKEVRDGNYHVTVHFYASKNYTSARGAPSAKKNLNGPEITEATFTVYIPSSHVPIAISTVEVAETLEAGVFNLVVKNGKVVDVKPTTMQIALSNLTNNYRARN